MENNNIQPIVTETIKVPNRHEICREVLHKTTAEKKAKRELMFKKFAEAKAEYDNWVATVYRPARQEALRICDESKKVYHKKEVQNTPVTSEETSESSENLVVIVD